MSAYLASWLCHFPLFCEASGMNGLDHQLGMLPTPDSGQTAGKSQSQQEPWELFTSPLSTL